MTLRIVAITGMPGAGKSTAAQALVSAGWKRVVMGDVIRSETKRRGLELDAKGTGEVMRLLRKERGESAVADLCLETISKMGANKVVVDGIRSLAEVEAFRKNAAVLLIAVDASPSRRFALLKDRGRKDDPMTKEMFQNRDLRELGVGIGEAIALADETVSNEHDSPERLEAEMKRVVAEWESREPS
jgi:dephospho-CoA kinase